MNCTFTPQLTPVEKRMLSGFLQNILNTETFTYSFPPQLSEKIGIYVDGKLFVLNNDNYWYKSPPWIYIGAREQASYDVLAKERLSILLTLSQLCEPSEGLTNACTSAISRFLLGEFKEVSATLIESATEAVGIAFHTDQRIASCIGGEWMLPSGEPVDVSGEGWTVSKAELPVVSEPRPFVVGDRVRWTPSGGEARSYPVGEGMIESTSEDDFRLQMDAGYQQSTIFAHERDLTHID